MKTVKKLLKILLAVVLGVVLLAGIGLGVLTAAEFRPADTEAVPVEGEAVRTLKAGDTLTVLSWNVGYGALGDNADFFMDGGTMVQTADENRVKANLDGIRAVLQREAPELYYLQEVDLDSDRSWHIDEKTTLTLGGHAACTAVNYRALYVPYPIPPIGHVESGLVTCSAFRPASAERLSLPCPFTWPVRLGQLKRCLLVTRIPVEGTDRELVAVNLHLEAYDDGSGKAAQSRVLSAFLQAEAAKGNYVIAGGDFNQTTQPFTALRPGLWEPALLEIPETVHMPENAPTCRSLDQPLSDAPDFQFYTIDGFIVSDNVELLTLETLDEGFRCADHNPVRLTVRLREE